MPKAFYKYSGVGRRKTSVARVYMNEGKGEIMVNNRKFEEYFPVQIHQMVAKLPLVLVAMDKKLDIHARILGGGITGQAEALRHGISNALLKVKDEFRSKLKAEGFLTRDSRKKERKKYGQPGARKRFQYSKR